MPKISVITVCFNAEKHIEETIRSVVNQKDCDIEYIIVDGVSTDGTKKIIQQYDSQITQWVSEPDQGIADAMNKGAALAAGEYILFLHADDYLVGNFVISKAISYMRSDVDIYAFDIMYKTKGKMLRKSTQPFGVRTYFKTPVMHQGAFCKKMLLKKLGGFNTDFKIAMDYEFFYKAYQEGAVMEVHHHVLSVMRDTGVSSRKDWGGLKQRFLEEKMVHSVCGGAMSVVYRLYWWLYLSYRQLKYMVGR